MSRSKLGYVLVALGAGVAGCGAEGMQADGAPGEEVGSAELGVEYTGLTFEIDDAIPLEHCALPATKRDVVGIGRQIRIKDPLGGGQANSGVALCTVDASASGNDGKVLVSTTTMQRRFSVTPTVSNVTITNQYDSSAAQGDIALNQPGSTPSFSFTSGVQEWVKPAFPNLEVGTHKVIYAVPHGIIESSTETQVNNQVVGHLAPWDAVWMALLRFDSQSTGPKYLHITSEDISEHSFQALKPMMDHHFDYAASFHGCSTECPSNDVVIGGDEEELFRRGVTELLKRDLANVDVPIPNPLPGGPTTRKAVVTLVTSQMNFPVELSGTHNNNFVNRLAKGGRGLQIEQSSGLRITANAADTVAATVKSVYDCLLDVPDATKMNMGAGELFATATNYASLVNPSGGICKRYTAYVESTAALQDIEALGECTVGGTMHTDIYRQRSDGTWDRIGGGFFRGDGPWSSEIPCMWGQDPDYVWPGVTGITDMAPGKFRIVVDVRDASGAIKRAGVRVQS